jgi:RNA polymerase sigma-70 factor (ECF subfamily)
MFFPTTHWTLLAQATLQGETESRSALDELFRRYWSPLHQFIRWRGYDATEAQDLTQAFLLHLVEHSTLQRVNRESGRFRSFLLGALARFLADQKKSAHAQKRGGGQSPVSLDAAGVEAVADPGLPGDEVARFDRAWAIAVFKTTLARVREEYAGAGRSEVFAQLKLFLPGSAEQPPYEQVAADLGCSVAALNSEVRRLRQRFKEMVRAEVAATVSAPHETDEEIAHLRRVLLDRATDFQALDER